MKRSVLAFAFLTTTVGFRSPAGNWPIAVARAAPFTETIVESGVISSQQLRLYSSTIAGAPAKIVELAAEGRPVKAGDVLIRFDASGFMQSRDAELAALRRVEAELASAREDLRLEGLRAEEELATAQQDVETSERDLANQRDGRGALAVAEAEAAAAEASRALARARTMVEEIAPLLPEGFVTRAEVDRAQQALRQAEDQERLAIAKRDALVRYERPAATSKAQTALNLARGALVRQAETAVARVNQRRAALNLATSRREEILARVALLDAQIDRATVRAEGPGLVVYRGLFFGTEQRRPQIGDEVFPNQPIIALPDTSQLTVETRVREVDLHKVSASQRVTVQVDAYPDLRLGASVSTIGALAEADATRAGAKFFPLTIALTSSDSRLRTGMTARVAIEVASLASAIVVPVHAVFGTAGRYAVILHNGRPERRALVIAGENETVAAVAAGLKVGDQVLLADPTASPAR